MRIGQVNNENLYLYKKLFQQVNYNKNNKVDMKRNTTKNPSSASTSNLVEVAPGYFCENDPRIIANFKKSFDEDGDKYNSYGVAGLDITNKDPSEWQQIINISDKGKEALFDMVKSEFINNFGIPDGDKTRKSDVYHDYYRSIPKADRLKAGWTLGQLEQKYNEALINIVKAHNPNWHFGQKFDTSILDNITKESIEGGFDISI